MRRVIGMDIHRTFAEVVVWEDGRLRPHGRVDMTRSGLEGFARGLTKEDEVVVEATGNAMAVVRVLSPHVARVIVANRSCPGAWCRSACPRFGPRLDQAAKAGGPRGSVSASRARLSRLK